MVSIQGLSKGTNDHLNKMIADGAVKVSDGVYYFQTKEDPYGDTPKSIEQLIEFVVWGRAFHCYFVDNPTKTINLLRNRGLI